MSQAARQVETEPALRGLFDHAGMFPPASKHLAAALADAATFPGSLQRPGLVGADLVIAWKDWPRLDGEALRAAGFQGTCRVAVVGATQEQGLEVARAIAGRDAEARRAVRVVSLEVHSDGALDPAVLRPTALAARGVAVFAEPRWPSGRLVKDVGAAAATAKAAGVGLKVRCAGPTATDRPALAACVRAAADAGVPFKATQGLHHPLPRPGFPHGFVNLLAAVRLRQVHGERFGDVEACLGEADPKAFDLRDGIAWRGQHVGAAKLAHLPPFAIGSCSLSEPDDDLVAAFGPPGAR